MSTTILVHFCKFVAGWRHGSTNTCPSCRGRGSDLLVPPSQFREMAIRAMKNPAPHPEEEKAPSKIIIPDDQK